MQPQCEFVYPYPSVSDFDARNSDHGPSKNFRVPQTLYALGKGETQTMVQVSGEGKLRPWSEPRTSKIPKKLVWRLIFCLTVLFFSHTKLVWW